MNILDSVILVVTALFALAGFWFGLFHTIGSVVGTVVGAYIASRYYEGGAQWLIATTGWGENVSRVIFFIVIFFFITRMIGVVFWAVGKVGSLLLPIPFKQSLNRFFGMIFGVVEGVVTIGIMLYFVDKFPLSERIMDSVETSVFAPTVILIASILIPLFPEALRMLQSTVDTIEQSL